MTAPIPVKDRVFPPVITPGPEDTAKVTGRPLDAAADKTTTFVASWSPMGGKTIVCWPLPIVSVPVAIPCQLGSVTVPTTA